MLRRSVKKEPAGIQQNPLGDPKAFRGMSTTLKKLSQPEKKSDFLPSFSSGIGSFAVEVLKIIVIALAIIIPIRYFVLQPFYVKGASMEPNFHDNEYLIIDEISYRFHQPRRGDVVVLRNPHRPSEFFIKRIIGLPGERININDNRVSVTPVGSAVEYVLDESAYLNKTVLTAGHLTEFLADREYYVLGDNRPASLDSRSFGPIDRREIIGRTAVRAWPLYRMRTFGTPLISYQATSQ